MSEKIRVITDAGLHRLVNDITLPSSDNRTISVEAVGVGIGAGKDLSIKAGDGEANVQSNGGYLYINGGSAGTPDTNIAGRSGSVYIATLIGVDVTVPGNINDGGRSGTLRVSTGAGGSHTDVGTAGNGGSVGELQIFGGIGGTSTNGWGGNGGSINIVAGDAGLGSIDGSRPGSVSITAGSGFGSGSGGNTIINAGAAGGSSVPGDVLIGNNPTTTSYVYLGDGNNCIQYNTATNTLSCRQAGIIDLPNNFSSQFNIEGIAVSSTVTAYALDILTAGPISNADAYHTHNLAGPSDYINVGKVNALSNNTDGYMLQNMSELSDESFPAYIVNIASGTIQNLYVAAKSIDGGQNVVVTIRKNNSNSSITATLTNGSTQNGFYYVTDLVNTLSVVRGDIITVRFVSSVTANAQNIYVSAELVKV